MASKPKGPPRAVSTPTLEPASVPNSVPALRQPRKKGAGRPKASNTPFQTQQLGQAKRESALVNARQKVQAIRDIAPLPMNINWERRLSTRHNLKLFCDTYLPNVFSLSWSESLIRCKDKVEKTFIDGGKVAIAVPRGGGKTALCRAAMIWGTLNAHRDYPFLIGSAEKKAQASLTFIKAAIYGSVEIQQDFPEIAYPVLRLENRNHLAKGQLYNSLSTMIIWGDLFVRFPILILTEQEIEQYQKHIPEFCIKVKGKRNPNTGLVVGDGWMTRNGGVCLQTAGIEGSIRGEAGVHPILLTQPRPDIVLLDDVQKDNMVDSSESCDKLKTLIDGAISGLSGPTEHIAAIMPCTVMRENDVADTYVNAKKKPDWRGERHAMVISWPEGIDDTKITLDSPEGRAWNEYWRLRIESLEKHDDNRLGTEYYRVNRELMDKNFIVSWKDRWDRKASITAQQSAMDLRFEIGSQMFMCEYQNKGRKPAGEGIVPITARQLSEKIISLPKRIVPVDTRTLVAFIDVQNEILYYTVLACTSDYTGVFTDYDGFPTPFIASFRKHQTEDWSLLSKYYFEAYPDQISKAEKSRFGMRAPLEPKIYHALNLCVKHLLGLEFYRDDAARTALRIQKIGIDTQWGQVSETIRRFIRDWSNSRGSVNIDPTDPNPWVGRDILIPYFGKGISEAQKQMEEWPRTRGWLFEDNVSPQVREVRWVWKPDEAGQYCLHSDVNRWKSFLFQRLASPLGARGSIALYNNPPDLHAMFAQSVCDSEYPYIRKTELQLAQYEKQLWKPREGTAYDNDFLDCATGCVALASFTGGAYIQHQAEVVQSAPPSGMRMSQLRQTKRRA